MAPGWRQFRLDLQWCARIWRRRSEDQDMMVGEVRKVRLDLPWCVRILDIGTGWRTCFIHIL